MALYRLPALAGPTESAIAMNIIEFHMFYSFFEVQINYSTPSNLHRENRGIAWICASSLTENDLRRFRVIVIKVIILHVHAILIATPSRHLPPSFFVRPAEVVAPELIGCLLVKRHPIASCSRAWWWKRRRIPRRSPPATGIAAALPATKRDAESLITDKLKFLLSHCIF